MAIDESASAIAQTIEREDDMMGFPWCCASGIVARDACRFPAPV
jgi:hypothetical protein